MEDKGMRTIEEKINHLKDIQRYCGSGRHNDGTPDKEILDEAIEAMERIHNGTTTENTSGKNQASKD